MAGSSVKNNSQNHTNKTFLVGLARAFAGAILFSFPVIMTMEMWSLGFTIETPRLVLLMSLSIPLLIGLSYFIGFEDTSCWQDDVVDAFVAYAVGFVTAAIFLLIFNVINFEMSGEEMIGIVSIEAVIGAIGAMLAQSQLGASDKNGSDGGGGEENEKRRRNARYFGELFLMIVGAVFLAMNVAPTEEIVLLSYKMNDTHTIILAIFTLVLMHAFVYKVEFRGQEKSSDNSPVGLFFRFTIVGYALSLLVGFYLIWTFGHTDGMSADNIARTVVVIGFPAALGASASRLIL
jgi:putative integral membrane protein (TIGR02587 family)